MKKSKVQKGGFSLIETLVATTILLLAVTAPLTIANRSLSSTKVAKDRITANFLVQDAIEYVKNVRSENNIQDGNWLESLDSCSSGCVVDSVAGTITSCSGSCPFLRFDSTTGFYGHDSSWQETEFQRILTLSTVGGGEASVSVNINWSSGNISQDLSLGGALFNWAGEDSCPECYSEGYYQGSYYNYSQGYYQGYYYGEGYYYGQGYYEGSYYNYSQGYYYGYSQSYYYGEGYYQGYYYGEGYYYGQGYYYGYGQGSYIPCNMTQGKVCRGGTSWDFLGFGGLEECATACDDAGYGCCEWNEATECNGIYGGGEYLDDWGSDWWAGLCE